MTPRGPSQATAPTARHCCRQTSLPITPTAQGAQRIGGLGGPRESSARQPRQTSPIFACRPRDGTAGSRLRQGVRLLRAARADYPLREVVTVLGWALARIATSSAGPLARYQVVVPGGGGVAVRLRHPDDVALQVVGGGSGRIGRVGGCVAAGERPVVCLAGQRIGVGRRLVTQRIHGGSPRVAGAVAGDVAAGERGQAGGGVGGRGGDVRW